MVISNSLCSCMEYAIYKPEILKNNKNLLTLLMWYAILILLKGETKMSQKSIYSWMRIAILAIAAGGIFVYAYLLPLWGNDIIQTNPELSHWLWPWLLFLWVTAVPIYWAMILAWNVSSQIKRDITFTRKTASLLKQISLLAFAEAGYFFAGNCLLTLLGMSHPGVFLVSCVLTAFIVLVALVFAALSHFVLKAAVLQEEADATV